MYKELSDGANGLIVQDPSQEFRELFSMYRHGLRFSDTRETEPGSGFQNVPLELKLDAYNRMMAGAKMNYMLGNSLEGDYFIQYANEIYNFALTPEEKSMPEVYKAVNRVVTEPSITPVGSLGNILDKMPAIHKN